MIIGGWDVVIQRREARHLSVIKCLVPLDELHTNTSVAASIGQIQGFIGGTRGVLSPVQATIWAISGERGALSAGTLYSSLPEVCSAETGYGRGSFAPAYCYILFLRSIELQLKKKSRNAPLKALLKPCAILS